MVKHIVLWELPQQADGKSLDEYRILLKGMLEGLVGVVPGLLKMEANSNLAQGRFNFGLYSEFESKKALEDYQPHPEHAKVRAIVSAICIEKAVFDYEV